jgi:hypothetical protein
VCVRRHAPTPYRKHPRAGVAEHKVLVAELAAVDRAGVRGRGRGGVRPRCEQKRRGISVTDPVLIIIKYPNRPPVPFPAVKSPPWHMKPGMMRWNAERA